MGVKLPCELECQEVAGAGARPVQVVPGGDELQLAVALVVNVMQLCVHIYLLPMGGPDARLLNAMQACTLVLTTYLNFGGLCLNYLELAQDYQELADGDEEGNEDAVTYGKVSDTSTDGLLDWYDGKTIGVLPHAVAR